MNLLVVGGGGREHTIIKKLKENPAVETVYAVPGNGGIAADAICVPEIGATKIDAIVDDMNRIFLQKGLLYQVRQPLGWGYNGQIQSGKERLFLFKKRPAAVEEPGICPALRAPAIDMPSTPRARPLTRTAPPAPMPRPTS